MIYLEPASLGWEPVLQSWVNTLPDVLKNEQGKLIMALFHWALPVSISFVRKQCKVNIPPVYDSSCNQKFDFSVRVTK